MKKFEFKTKRSPVPSIRTTDGNRAELDDAASDYTDSEPGLSSEYDALDGTRSGTPDPSRTKEAVDSIKQKVDKIKMEIQREQAIKEDHVKEYLELSSKAGNDEAKAKNIKLVFEKNNQASAQAIAKLQKKLERLQTDIRRIEQHGASSHKAAKEVLMNVGQGLSSVVKTATDALLPSKPKELIGSGGKSKSGSVDNINTLAREGHSTFYTGFLDSGTTNGHVLADGQGSPVSHTGSTTLPANFKLHVSSGSDNNDEAGNAEAGSASEASYHARDSPHASSISPDALGISYSAIEPLLVKLNSNAESMERIAREVEMLRNQLRDFQEEMISKAVSDEEKLAERYDRLEDHLNDFVELTQNELTNLKQEISNMEEKIDYQLEERTRDLQEALENANNRISKLELQNQQQQLITMEVDNPNARVLLTKSLNVLLAFMAVILVFVSAIAHIVGPFLNSRWKMVSLVFVILAVVITSSRWELVTELIQQSLLQFEAFH